MARSESKVTVRARLTIGVSLAFASASLGVAQAHAAPGTTGATAATTSATGRRCGTPHQPPSLIAQFGPSVDCDAAHTNPSAEHVLGGVKELRVVFHVIEATDGSAGSISDAALESQVAVLNEDFSALAGTPGAQGVDVQFHFALADVDPQGRETNGIVRYQNDAWLADTGEYWETTSWDPTRYINVYTNTAGGLLGYTFPPANADSTPGASTDRVVIAWRAIGRNSSEPRGFNQGRTLTHELGHYFGLLHTFEPNPTTPETFQCPPEATPLCFSSGDLICDTASEEKPAESCEPSVSCGSADPIDNYMNYAADACLTHFTPQQALRMRCTLAAYRPLMRWSTASLSSQRPSLVGRANETLNYSVRLRNSGSREEAFTLSLHARDADVVPTFASSGTNTLGPIALRPGETSAVQVQSRLPAMPAASSGTIILSAEAESGGANGTIVLESQRLDIAPFALLLPKPQRVEPEVMRSYPLELSNGTPVALRVGLELPANDSANFSQFAANDASTLELDVPGDGSVTRAIVTRVPRHVALGEDYALRVSATLQSEPSFRVDGALVLTAGPLFGASLEPLNFSESAPPGATLRHSITVRNQGNAPDEFLLRVQRLSGAASIELVPRSTGTLAAFGQAGDAATIDVQLDLPAVSGSRAPLVVVLDVHRAQNSASLASSEWRIQPAASHGVRWFVPEASQLGFPGQEVRFFAELRNQGNTADEFSVRLEPATFATTATKLRSLTLSEGASATIEFLAAVPPTATPGDLLSATLIAESATHRDSASRQELQLQVREGPLDVSPPLVGESRTDAGVATPMTQDAAPTPRRADDAGRKRGARATADGGAATADGGAATADGGAATAQPPADCSCRGPGRAGAAPPTWWCLALALLGLRVTRRRANRS